MMPAFNYELNKLKSQFRFFGLTVVLVHFSSLIFFALVGHFETGEEVSVLTETLGIQQLATTLTLSVAILYGVILFNRFLLRYYIRQAREQFYLFPGGRTSIFRNKNHALMLHFSRVVFALLLFENLVFYLLGSLLGRQVLNLGIDVLKISVLNFLSVMIGLVIIQLSVLVGQVRQSTNASLISAIILVSILGNGLAYLYKVPLALLVILSLMMISLCLSLIKVFEKRILSDDVIEL